MPPQKMGPLTLAGVVMLALGAVAAIFGSLVYVLAETIQQPSGLDYISEPTMILGLAIGGSCAFSGGILLAVGITRPPTRQP